MTPRTLRLAEGPLGRALHSCRRALFGVAAMSAVLNILTLSGSFFMLLVYDTVLPSHSLPTLVALGLILALLYAFQGAFDFLRTRVLSQVGAAVDAEVSGPVFDSLGRISLTAPGQGDGLQPVRDLDQIRGFLSGQGPVALIDLPWMVFFLAICFVFHWLIGVTALAGALVLVVLTLANDRMTRDPIRAASEIAGARNGLAAASRQNAEAIHALGMQDRLRDAWHQINHRALESQQKASGVAGGLGVATRILRMAIQSLVLAVGAYLVLQGEASGGVIIAASILTARALAPVEVAIANWRGFVGARQSWARLTALFASMGEPAETTALPPPVRTLSLEGVSLAPPGAQKLSVIDVTFSLAAGSGLGVVGPSGSGKSSLARAIVNVWKPLRGAVRLDGAALDQWDPVQLGRHIGYLPQNVELMSGSVAQNIARFDPNAPHEAIIDAAMKANVHDLIVRLPEGYDTQIGDAGAQLSAGQRQRVALARALFGDPLLVVLDEPNSNLDSEGEQALISAMQGVRDRGGIVIVVAHRPAILAPVDHVLLIRDGRTQMFGPRDEVLAKILPPQVRGPAPRPTVSQAPAP